MASTQLLKRRIRSVKSTRQITKAMELVAASKLKRAQTRAESSKAYGELALKIMVSIASQPEVKSHPLFMVRPKNGKVLYVVFGSDRGLAGALNSNVIGAFSKHVKQSGHKNVDAITVGRKIANYFARLKDFNLLASYQNMGDYPEPAAFGPVVNTIVNPASANYERIYIIYTVFESTLRQKVSLEQLLPIELPSGQTAGLADSYELEPSAEDVLSKVGELFLDARVARAYIESTASEQAMRMMAMSNATKSAGDLIEGLSLELNSRRQAAITQEIAEITSGAEAVA